MRALHDRMFCLIKKKCHVNRYFTIPRFLVLYVSQIPANIQTANLLTALPRSSQRIRFHIFNLSKLIQVIVRFVSS